MRYARGSGKFWNRSIERRRSKDFGGIRRDAVAARSRIILAGVGSQEKRAGEFKKGGDSNETRILSSVLIRVSPARRTAGPSTNRLSTSGDEERFSIQKSGLILLSDDRRPNIPQDLRCRRLPTDCPSPDPVNDRRHRNILPETQFQKNKFKFAPYPLSLS